MRLIPLLFLLLLAGSVSAQSLSGFVRGPAGDGGTEPLVGANVWYDGTTIGVATDLDGKWTLQAPESYPVTINIQYIGFQQKQVVLEKHTTAPINTALSESAELKAVNIKGRTNGSNINTIDPILTEQLNEKELTRAACCNLSESFETNAAVDVQSTDAVSGSKMIRMLGLDGVYTQILSENLPYIRGLSAAYGLAHVPGTWPSSIQIIKGRGSVVNGYESLVGSINLEMQKPDEADPVFLNLFANEMGRYEVNTHAAARLNEKWSTMLFLHGSTMQTANDRNYDGFLDSPLREQVNVFNRWKYFGEKYRAQFGIRALQEDIQGGQTAFNYDSDYGKSTNYGVGVRAQQMELWGKNGIIFSPTASLGIMANARIYTQDSYFGNRVYAGEQQSFYLNSIFQDLMKGEAHSYKAGASLVYDDYQESFNDSAFSRTEVVPGVFGEYTFSSDNEQWAAVAGVRSDFHNLYGTRISPSLNVRYSPKKLTAFRVAAGRGFRTANAFVEQAAVLASSRRVFVDESLQPEQAWNFGTSVTHKFPLFGLRSSLNADYYYTHFENRVVVDLENWGEVRFYNLNGTSFANSAQVQLGVEPAPGLEVKAAYKWYDVRTTYKGVLKRQPLVPEHRAFLNVAYETQSERWRTDATVQWVGASRIPHIPGDLDAGIVRERSNDYVQLNMQATRVWKRWEVYLGVENLLGYQQPNPIISPDNPFGEDFDASLVWGRASGRTVYGGLRFKLTRKDKDDETASIEITDNHDAEDEHDGHDHEEDEHDEDH